MDTHRPAASTSDETAPSRVGTARLRPRLLAVSLLAALAIVAAGAAPALPVPDAPVGGSSVVSDGAASDDVDVAFLRTFGATWS